MISPHTPPGTKVVCINAAPSRCRVTLVLGQVYTLREWTDFEINGPNGTREHGLYLEEIANGSDWCGEFSYNRQRFRRAELPSCLIELLKPVHLPHEELV